MKILNLLLVFILAPLFLHSQVTIQGKILDASDRSPISFVNIGIKALANGTVSDENGQYLLSINNAGPQDVVTISAIGFEAQELPLKDLMQKKDVLLQPKAYDIEGIELSARQWNAEEILIGNDQEKRKQSIGFANSVLGTEIGGLLEIDKETWIKSAHFVVNRGSKDSMLFRLNVYEFENEKLGENLLQENVLIAAPRGKGLLSIDLEKYNLVADKNILLSLQWIKAYEKNGELLITFNAQTSGRRNNLFIKPTSVSDFGRISEAFPGAPKYELCFYIKGQQVK